MKRIVSFIDGLCQWTGKLVSFLIFFVVGVVCLEVVMRYVFHRPTIFATEAMVFGCAFIYVLGTAWTLQDNRHVKIDMLWERFSPKGRKILDSITFIFFAFYIGMLLWVGGKFAKESVQLLETSGSPWDPPVYPVKIAFAVGVFLLLLQGISKLIKDLYYIFKGRDL